MQVWRTKHPLQHPESGLRAASVHTGFLRAWTTGGFRCCNATLQELLGISVATGSAIPCTFLQNSPPDRS